jgi:peptidoglycan/LPS O-acetylase OafA/YrhL
MTATINRARIEFLDYMRVFAFISVLVGHKLLTPVIDFAADDSHHSTLRWIAEVVVDLCVGGGAGVTVFFLTSGYIITHVVRGDAPTDFLIKRFFRIYPLYVFAVLLETILNRMVHGIPIDGLAVMIPRLLLLGDFFGTPYALAGVEWTLRLEVMFYLYMAVLRVLHVFSYPRAVPLFYLVTAAAMAMLPPFPSGYGWSDGYVSIFLPYLFIGSLLYLQEQRLISKPSWAAASGALFIISLVLFGEIQPRWNGADFPVLAVAIFWVAWALRGTLAGSPVLRLLSDLTFSVYLFHNWLWSYIGQALTALHVAVLPQNLQILVVLFVACYLSYRYIELPGIRMGRWVLGNRLVSLWGQRAV